MAVQWDKEKGLTGWGIDLGNIIRRKKDLPKVNDKIQNFITSIEEDYNGVGNEHMEHARPIIIERTKNLSDVTNELREDFVDFLNTADLSGDIMEQYQQHLIDTSQTTSSFASFTQKAGNILKSFGASLASMGVNFAIGEILSLTIGFLDDAAKSEQKAAETAREAFNETSASVEKHKENVSTLNSIAEKYQQIKNSDTSDTEKRNTLITLQNELNSLIGGQTNGLDLINGKLDTQLTKIREITEEEKKNAYYNSIGNYNNAKTVANTAQEQNVDGSSDFVYRERYIDKSTFDVLENAGFPVDTNDNNMFMQMIHGFNVVPDKQHFVEIRADKDENGNLLETLEDKLAYLKRMQETLLKSGKSNTGIYTAITTQIEDWESLLKKQSGAAMNLAESYVAYHSDPSGIDSVESFKEYRDKLIEETKNSPEISQLLSDGMLNEEDLKNIIDSYLSTAEGFSTWFDNWKNNIQSNIPNTKNIPATLPTKTFSQAWNSIDTTGTDEQKSDKQKLLELAEAGKLTEEALKNTSLASIFEEAGVSIEEATKKVNAFADETKQLSAMKTGINAITSAYKEKSNSSQKTVSSSTLESLGDTLGTEDWNGSDKKVWENYKSVAGDNTKTLKELKAAQDELAASYVNSNNFLSNIEDGSYQYYVSLLKEMGVTNAAAVATEALNRKKADAKLTNFNLAEASNEEIASFGNYITSLQGANGALGDYIIKKQLAAGADLETSGSIQNLINLATQCGATSDVIIALKELLNATDDLSSAKSKSLNDYNLSAGTDLKHAYDDLGNQKDADVEKNTIKVEKAKSKLKKLLKGAKTAVTTSPGIKTNGGDGNTTQKESKQEFNWLERRLTRMQNIIDLTAAKLQNLFSVNGKTKNLDRQIKQSTRLMKQYDSAAKKYQAKANSIANGTKKEKGLPTNIVNQIKSGRLTKEKAKVSKKYSQSEYDKINQYIDNFDKAQNARKNSAEQKAKTRDLRKQKYQVKVDDADAKISLYEQKKNNAATAGKKNEYLGKELKQYKRSYQYQLSIAKLSKDTTEQARLRAEYEAKIVELKKEQLQNTLEKNEERNTLLDARLANASTADEKNAILNEQIGVVQSDNQAYAANYSDALSNRTTQSKKASKTVSSDKSKKLKKADKQKIKQLISKNQPIPDSLINKCSAKTQAQLAEYNASLDWVTDALKDKTLNDEQSKTKERELNVQQHQNNADERQAQLDLLAAYEETLTTAADKNQVVEQEKALTSQLYAEKMEIARLEGNLTKQQQLQAELTSQLVAFEKKKLDNIVQYYDNQRKINNNQSKNLSNSVNELEARGLIATSKLYSSQMALNEEKKRNYENELYELTEQHKKIKEGTQEWYASLDSIQACKDGIAECTNNSIELAASIRNIDWKVFEKLSSGLDLLTSEYDLFINMMSNKKLVNDDGNFTEEGISTLGAQYAKLLLIKKKHEESSIRLQTMKEKMDNGDEGYTGQNAIDDYNKAFKESIEYTNEELNIEREIIDLMKERYSAELNYMQDIINKRKELLQAEKDEYDYRRTINDKTKNISVISKQLNALSGDDSEAARTKIQQLKVSLDEAKQDLQDTEYDKWISDQQVMLDNLYNEYSSFIDDKMNDTDALLEEGIALLNDENVSKVMSDTLNAYAEQYNYNYSDSLASINNALGSGGSIASAVTTASETLSDQLKKMQENQSAADEITMGVNNLQEINTYEDYQKAKTLVKNYNDSSDEVKSLVGSNTKSSINEFEKKISSTETAAGNTQNRIKSIGTVTLDSQEAILNALNSYNALDEIGKQIVDRSGWTDVMNRANSSWTNLYNERMNKQNAFRQVMAATYLADAHQYAIPNTGDNATYCGDVRLDALLKNLGLWRGDNLPLSESGAALIMNRLTGRTPLPGQAFSEMYKYMQSIGFADGGIASTLQKVPVANGDDGWITIKRGESVLTREQTRSFAAVARNLDTLSMTTDLTANLSESKSLLRPEQGIHSTSIGDISMNIELPNVTNYEEFRRQMQSDPKIESMFKSMIWDKGSLSKYRTNM